MTPTTVSIRVLSATPFVDRSDPAAPKDKVLVAYILNDGRMGSFRMDPFGDNLGKRNQAVLEDAKVKFEIPEKTEISATA